tara:strand:+ start:4040 stop:4807 length:768 start_codon:yes stop_codon:yes gene_type:complete
MNSTAKAWNRRKIFYGDSHVLAYEINHDQILGRNTFNEKRQLVTQYGLHNAILLWNQKMGRASGMPVYDFIHQRLANSYPVLYHDDAIIRANGAMSMDYLYLQLVNDYNNKELIPHEDSLYIGVCRPTRTFKLTDTGRFDFAHEDFTGGLSHMSDIQYAVNWALSVQSIIDFLEKKDFKFKFIKHFPLFKKTDAPIKHIDLKHRPKYMDLFMQVVSDMQKYCTHRRLDEFGDRLGFWHTDAEGHRLFAEYLKNNP